VISYKIENDGIVKVDFEGLIVYEDIAKWLTEFSGITQLPNQIKLFYDMRKANLRVDMLKLIQITKKTEEVTSKYQRVRTAFLTEEAVLSTYSMLLSFLDIKGKTSRQVFTNYAKAAEWLLNGNV